MSTFDEPGLVDEAESRDVTVPPPLLGQARLPRAIPEDHGLASAGVLAMLDAWEQAGLGVHSVMVVLRGAVVAEGWWDPYGPHLRHDLFSLSKSFTSAAVGLAEAEGLLSVDDLLLDHLGADLDRASVPPHLAAMRLSHLLTMTTGHDADPTDHVFAQRDWVQTFLDLPVEHEPGTHFVYNTAATYMLGAVVAQVTGQRLLDYLTPRLLEPLGVVGARWDQCPLGRDIGGSGLALTTEDVACFGRLLLQDGVWEGRRLLPEGWVARATARQVASSNENVDWRQGYGYQFWRARHGYRGDGAFGQFCVVLPEHDAVVAITSGDADMQGILDVLWEHLLPALGASHAPPEPGVHEALVERLAGLRLDPPGAGELRAREVPEGAVAWSGRRIVFEPNPLEVRWAVLELGEHSDRLSVAWGRRTFTLDLGHATWALGMLRVPGSRRPEEHMAASAAWAGSSIYEVTVRRVETPSCYTWRFTVDDDVVRVEGEVDVAFGPTVMPPLVGRFEEDDAAEVG